jgi:hypothetical protein
MLLTLTTTAAPATDLGYLLGKNPARLQTFELAFGKAHVFYPEASATRCTAALVLEVDPVGLVRGRRGPAGEGGALEQYVNDRWRCANSRWEWKAWSASSAASRSAGCMNAFSASSPWKANPSTPASSRYSPPLGT